MKIWQNSSITLFGLCVFLVGIFKLLLQFFKLQDYLCFWFLLDSVSYILTICPSLLDFNCLFILYMSYEILFINVYFYIFLDQSCQSFLSFFSSESTFIFWNVFILLFSILLISALIFKIYFLLSLGLHVNFL